MTDIFISYKREDQATAKRLAEAFEAKGWSVWWDPKLRAGEHFDTAIEEALRKARCVVVLWSQRSVQSQYVKDEASYALKLAKLVPALIEKVEPPFRFQGIHTVDLSSWDASDRFPAFRKLIDDLAAQLGPPQPRPAQVTDADLAKARELVDRIKQTAARREALYQTEIQEPDAERLRLRAVADDAEAAFQLGMRYRNGQGVPKDDGLAFDWLHKAAYSGGHAGAKAFLKKIYKA
ncbi:MAG TPA: TIR domain-containing protein [Thermoanaerobaculia bacterium]|nr:TIR domain-containing protein [Thermoanaerobaculia bacterium]